jgi:uncharacterized protein with PIN domain
MKFIVDSNVGRLARWLRIAGFDTVFIGIETPNEESLAECNKLQNQDRDLVASVKIIQNRGLEVQRRFSWLIRVGIMKCWTLTRMASVSGHTGPG